MAQEPDPRPTTPPNIRYIQAGEPLPRPMAPFVGRTQEIAAIRRVLADPDVRLLTLLGPGGVGKTRLSLEVASCLNDLQQAVNFAPLSAISSAADVPLAIANALNVQEGPGGSLMDALKAALRNRPTLLVLDNVEHLLPHAASVVSEILTGSPALRVLATSRVPLRIYGERRFPVRPLPLSPSLPASAPLTDVDEPDAVRLFILRAQAVDPEFPLTRSSRRDIADICARLDGLPLAIELAAARAAEIPPRTYLQRLVQSLPLPEGGALDVPQRQQTMAAAVGWSYRLLSPDQQAMLRRMAVFAGPFDLEAAEAMAEPLAGDDPGLAGMALLTSLVEASLIQRRSSASGEPWYEMLETIRAFALERATAEDEAEVLGRRHALHHLELAGRVNAELLAGRRMLHWLAHLDERMSNVRAAMAWCERNDPGLLVRFTRDLMQYWLRRSRIREGIGWLARALEQTSSLPEIDRGWVLANLGRLNQYAMDTRAAQAFESALEIASRQNDHELELAVRIGQVVRAAITGQHSEARAAFEAAQRIPDVQQVALRVTQPTFLATIEAMIASHSGDLDRAAHLATEALSRAIRDQDDIAPALLHRILATVDRGHGDRASARDHILAAVAVYDAFGEEWNVASCLLDLSRLHRGEHPELALRLLAAADRLLANHQLRPPGGDQELPEYLDSEFRQHLGDERVRELWRQGGDEPWRNIVDDVRGLPMDQGHDPSPSGPAERSRGAGGTLSRREREVLQLVAAGLSDREIADRLSLSYRTITSHVTSILTKLGVSSRTAAATRALQDGLLDD